MTDTRTRPRALTIALLLATALVLAACGTAGGDGNGDGNGNGDDDPDGPPTPTPGATQIGYVSVVEEEPSATDPSVTASSVSASAGFMGYDAELPDEYVADPYAYGVDTCTVTDFAADPELPDPGDVDVDITPLAAGDAITLHAGGDVYATLEDPSTDEVAFSGVYATDADLAGPVPDDLTVTVPGDEFPAFTDAELPDVAPVELTAPADASGIGTDATFEWTPAPGDDATYVRLGLFAGTFTTATYVTCVVEDDGTFELPEETVAELGAEFSGTLSELARLAVRTETSGDATLVLESEWVADVPLPLP